MTLLVSEVFGPTVQGEGPSAGRRCGFVRLGMCNLDCSWCDTPYTWDWTGKNGPPQDRAALVHMTGDEVTAAVERMGVDMVVVSGGEPLLQRRAIAAWLTPVARRYRVEVETNGTRAPGVTAEWVDQFNVSPKLPHSGVPEDKAWRSEPLAALLATGKAIFKVVCKTVGDVSMTAGLARRHDIPAHLVWVMPEGRTQADINDGLAAVADATIAAGFNLSGRLHVATWGDRRGV